MPETNSEPNLKTCLECGEHLGPGREDRKFCNDICRTAYNNRRRKEPAPAGKLPQLFDKETDSTRHVYEILLNNRSILYHYNEFFGDQIEVRDLIGRGFNLKFFTSEYLASDGGTYRFCFDYGYYIRGEMAYILERPEETF
ncbi:hypothetical protein BDD43_2313 [Mucilaginibacter gracilis]|uniref:DUF2116 family Zn-ribbon domain-containing protein n=1 Tax=Mucilaginibacter gracilis TaxID=423350 RepID=A0A495J1G4_9SPHI|nr:hypothetical protein [Mucilaginibacter gracilis]RKR82144.1 hypothetical protein BDD43_2313 [Mucilaginibacter gracilis]